MLQVARESPVETARTDGTTPVNPGASRRTTCSGRSARRRRQRWRRCRAGAVGRDTTEAAGWQSDVLDRRFLVVAGIRVLQAVGGSSSPSPGRSPRRWRRRGLISAPGQQREVHRSSMAPRRWFYSVLSAAKRETVRRTGPVPQSIPRRSLGGRPALRGEVAISTTRQLLLGWERVLDHAGGDPRDVRISALHRRNASPEHICCASALNAKLAVGDNTRRAAATASATPARRATRPRTRLLKMLVMIGSHRHRKVAGPVVDGPILHRRALDRDDYHARVTRIFLVLPTPCWDRVKTLLALIARYGCGVSLSSERV